MQLNFPQLGIPTYTEAHATGHLNNHLYTYENKNGIVWNRLESLLKYNNNYLGSSLWSLSKLFLVSFLWFLSKHSMCQDQSFINVQDVGIRGIYACGSLRHKFNM